MACEIDVESQGLYVRFSGDISPEDIVILADAMQSSSAKEYSYRISNWLEVTSFQLSPVHVAHMISLDYVLGLDKPKLRKAVVAIDPLLVKKFYSWKMKSAQTDLLRLFSTVEDARAWVLSASEQP